MTEEERAIRRACNTITDGCGYPDCGCEQLPRLVEAALFPLIAQNARLRAAVVSWNESAHAEQKLRLAAEARIKELARALTEALIDSPHPEPEPNHDRQADDAQEHP